MSEGGSGHKTKAMQVCMWPGNEVMILVCRQADYGIFSTWANSVQCQRLADVFTKLHVSGSTLYHVYQHVYNLQRTRIQTMPAW